jgi:hypothetical protein
VASFLVQVKFTKPSGSWGGLSSGSISNGFRSPLSITDEDFLPMNKFLPYPLFVLFSIIAFNITAFAVVLQMNLLIFNATIFKVIAWLVTVGAWTIVYFFRNR